MSQLEQIKNFVDCERVDNDPKNRYESIKLEFSILHANKGLYKIHAKLFDDKLFDFNSDIKRSNKKQKITFEKFFTCDYYFQKEQKITIELTKDQQTFEIIKTLADIIGSKNCTLTHNYLRDEKLVIKAEKLGNNKDVLNIKFKVENNLFTNVLKKNKFYYAISNENNDLYQSSEISDEGILDSINIPINLLEPSYTVSFYNLSNELLVSFDSTINDIRLNKKRKINIPLKKKKSFVLYDHSEITKNFSFIDYIKSGVKIALSIGIDFTGSNGHPLDIGSLHYIHGPNDYERAITACAKIVGYYDDDQIFPVFGFGAKINSPGEEEASMCFNLNFSKNPDIHTLDNIIRIYHDCIENDKLTFSGPTKFGPLINKVISRINKEDIFEYHILMILTDGVLEDLQETIDILVDASLLPLSVIIIGIGDADFSQMDILDGDETPLTSSKGKKRKRDIVQFVPFNKYQYNIEELSMEVLAEIPRQIVEYYQFKDLNPEKIGNILGKSNNNNFDNIGSSNRNINNDNDNNKKLKIDIDNFNNINKFSNNNNINDYKNLNNIPNGGYNNIDTNNINVKSYDKDYRTKKNRICDNPDYFCKTIFSTESTNKSNSVRNSSIISSSRRGNKRYNSLITVDNTIEKKDFTSRSYSTQNNFKKPNYTFTHKKSIQANPFNFGNINFSKNQNKKNLNIDNIDDYLDENKGKRSRLIDIGFDVINRNNNNMINGNNRLPYKRGFVNDSFHWSKVSLQNTIPLDNKEKNNKFK